MDAKPKGRACGGCFTLAQASGMIRVQVTLKNYHFLQVGLVMKQRGSALIIDGFVRGSPSFMCGTLERGDQIHAIDGVMVDGMPRGQVAALLFGPAYSQVCQLAP